MGPTCTSCLLLHSGPAAGNHIKGHSQNEDSVRNPGCTDRSCSGAFRWENDGKLLYVGLDPLQVIQIFPDAEHVFAVVEVVVFHQLDQLIQVEILLLGEQSLDVEEVLIQLLAMRPTTSWEYSLTRWSSPPK